jgi:alpha/beta superfamily hydrolase
MAGTTSRVVELASLPTADGVDVDALIHSPADGRRPVASVIHLHGKGGNFYSGPGRQLPTIAGDLPIRHVALNMRCHDLGYTRADRPYVDQENGGRTPVAGGYWERLDEGRVDVKAAVDHVRSLGPEPIFLAGLSSGGFYVASYCADNDDIAGRIVISPVLSNKRPLTFWFPEPGGVDRASELARDMVAAGRGYELIPVSHWFYAISADSLLERVAEADDAWLGLMNSSPAPVLHVWGSRETRGALWQEHFDALTAPDKTRVVIDGADHSYLGHMEDLGRTVDDFVARLVSR